MSYSFSVNARSKHAAKRVVTRQLMSVALQQPVHAADLPAAVACAHAMIDAVDEDGPLTIACHGAVNYRDVVEGNPVVMGVNFGFSITRTAD